LFRLNDGVTYAKFLADLQTSRTQALFVDSSSAGGAGDLAPGGQTVWEAMQGGSYAVVSLVIDSKGTPDYAKGMVPDFTVAGQATPQELAAVHPAGPVAGVITARGVRKAGSLPGHSERCHGRKLRLGPRTQMIIP
jgi:hypothetical protein